MGAYLFHGNVSTKPIPYGEVTLRRVLGDDWNDKKHHGHIDQAIWLSSIELIEELKAEWRPLFPGALGENFTRKDLDSHSIRLDTIYRIDCAPRRSHPSVDRSFRMNQILPKPSTPPNMQ